MTSTATATCCATSLRSNMKAAPLEDLADNLRLLKLKPTSGKNKSPVAADGWRHAQQVHHLAQIQTGMLLQRTASGNLVRRADSRSPPSSPGARRQANNSFHTTRPPIRRDTSVEESTRSTDDRAICHHLSQQSSSDESDEQLPASGSPVGSSVPLSTVVSVDTQPEVVEAVIPNEESEGLRGGRLASAGSSWMDDVDHAMVASGISSDDYFIPPEHLCPAGHTGDAGSEPAMAPAAQLCTAGHTGDAGSERCVPRTPRTAGEEPREGTREGIREGTLEEAGGETREEKKARRAAKKSRNEAKRAKKERNGKMKKAKQEDAEDRLDSVKRGEPRPSEGAPPEGAPPAPALGVSPSTAAWIALAESVSGDGLEGPIVTVVPSLTTEEYGVSERAIRGGRGWRRSSLESVYSTSGTTTTKEQPPSPRRAYQIAAIPPFKYGGNASSSSSSGDHSMCVSSDLLPPSSVSGDE